MRPKKVRDLNRRASVRCPLLAGLLAVGPQAIGDGPAKGKGKDKPDPFQIVDAIAEFGSPAGSAGLDWVRERAAGAGELLERIMDCVAHVPANPWLYKTVMLKSPGTDLRVDGKIVPTRGVRACFHRFTVRKIEEVYQGNRLWVVDQDGFGLEGWVEEDEVVLEDGARAYFTALIKSDPQSALAHYWRGLLTDGPQATADFLKALGNDLPPIPPFDPRAANLADLTEAMRLDPACGAMAQLALGKIHSANSDRDRALAELTEAIRLDPAIAAWAHVAISNIYAQNQDSDRAIAELTEAIRLDPKLVVAYSERASLYSKKGDADHAIADLTETIRINPGGFQAYVNRAKEHEKKKDWDRAIADLTKALTLAPSNIFDLILSVNSLASCYLSRGRAHCGHEKYDLGIADFNKAVSLASPARSFSNQYIIGIHNRAYAWYLKGEYDLAIAGFTDMIKRSESNGEKAAGYAGRARVRVRTNDIAGALADCDKAREVAPSSPWGHEYRAWIMATCPEAKFRDGRKAVNGAMFACELTKWESPSCLETLAAAAAESGDFDAAVKWQTMALESLSDDDAKAQFRERLDLFLRKQPYRDVPSKIRNRQASRSAQETPPTDG